MHQPPRNCGEFPFTSVQLERLEKLRVGRLASNQFGLVARHQLKRLGISDGAIGWWLRTGYLYRGLPGVYAVGHTSASVQADLTAALLWAGPGAMLSHGCGAWWLGLTREQPAAIELCTPRHPRARPGIIVHALSPLERRWYRELPTPAIPELLLQFAATAPHNQLRKAISETQYQSLVDLNDLAAVCGQGRPGSTALRAALEAHLPQLAVTDSEFEDRMLFLCETHSLPLPECNAYIEGFKVDAVWRAQKLIVELDGRDGHAPWARVKRDRRRDLTLRSKGFTTLRYVWDQFVNDRELVATDIQAALG